MDWGDAQFCPRDWPEFAPRKKTTGVAAAPPMGWNPCNWNLTGKDADTMMQIADVMVSRGFLAAGYQYLNLDGGWAERPAIDEKGYPRPRKDMFPDGMQPFADYIHSKGLKF